MKRRPDTHLLETIAPLRRRLQELLSELAPGEGMHTTVWPGLQCFRSEGTIPPRPTLYPPCLCIVGQGAKLATLGDRHYRYDATDYLVVGASVPVRAEILEASAEEPFLALVLDFDLSSIHDLLIEIQASSDGDPWTSNSHQPSPIRVSELDVDLLGAVVRFLESLGDPTDLRILAPNIFRELIYLILRGEQGDLLRMAAAQKGASPAIVRAIRFIESRFDHDIDVSTIASEVGMSTTSLHQTFKQATALTPIQYLKRFRLHRALQLMIDEGYQAAQAASRVGYSSPSYFSREFKGLYGMPPRQYVEQNLASPLAQRLRTTPRETPRETPQDNVTNNAKGT